MYLFDGAFISCVLCDSGKRIYLKPVETEKAKNGFPVTLYIDKLGAFYIDSNDAFTVRKIECYGVMTAKRELKKTAANWDISL